MRDYILTSEMVGVGHPDFVADLISDTAVDLALELDLNAKVACETLVKDRNVILAGELKINDRFKFDSLIFERVCETVKKCKYNDKDEDFNNKNIIYRGLINNQSPEIHFSVTKSGEENLGAGDQGIVWGYASDETETYMPTDMYLMRKLLDTQFKFVSMQDGDIKRKIYRPDCKVQISIKYENMVPQYITDFVFSSCHRDIFSSIIEMRDHFWTYVMPEFKSKLSDELKQLFTKDTRYYINQSGLWTIGGPTGDSGVTGRKLITNSYGAHCEHGGGAQSGKDASKIDRSAFYMARHITKNIVASGISKVAKVQIGYVIAKPEPISFFVDTCGTGMVEDKIIETRASNFFDLRPSKIINYLQLREPHFLDTTFYGQVGGSYEHPWEKINHDFAGYLKA